MEIIGGFFCEACLTDKLPDEQSPDPRYCQGCCEFLTKEAKRLEIVNRPKWMPKMPKGGHGVDPQPTPDASASSEKTKGKVLPIPNHTSVISSPLKSITERARREKPNGVQGALV